MSNEIKFDRRNYRKHNDRNKELINKSLKECGAGRSIVIDNDNEIIAGNGIYEQAQKLGLKTKVIETDGSELVVVKRTDLQTDDAKRKQLAVMDNSTSDSSEFDFELLQEDFDTEELEDWGLDVDFAIEEEEKETDVKGSLADKFIVPPFSVLDTKQGYWQDRKKQWLKITGDLTETKENVLGNSDGNILASINGGSSNFDPVLAEIVMQWFNVPNGKILDPFGGEQTKGVVAGELNYPYYACEFREEQVLLNKGKTKQYKNVNYYCGDSNNISNIIKERGFDLCFTSPPYYDLEVYSKDDMSALGTYEEFMQQYKNIFRQCYNMLADNRFLVIKIGEIRDKNSGIYRNFVGDNISIFKEIGFNYYNEIILVNSCGTAPLRAGKLFNSSRKICKIHQNVLVFYKGDVKKIKNNYPLLDFAELEDNNENA